MLAIKCLDLKQLLSLVVTCTVSAGCGELQRRFPSSQAAVHEGTAFAGTSLTRFQELNECLRDFIHDDAFGLEFTARYVSVSAQESLRIDPLVSHVTDKFVEMVVLESLQISLSKMEPHISPTLKKAFLENFKSSCIVKK